MSEKTSKTEELLLKGKILEAWPYKEGAWALSITPTVAIDKVKFSFFKKGQNGKGFDIYVDGIVFLALMDNLRRRDFSLTTKWEYRTGENGSKQLSVENGSSALLAIHGFSGNKENNATVGINRQQADEMLALWMLFFKRQFEEKWEKAFTEGQIKQNERPADNAPAKTDASPETLVEGVIGNDIKEQGRFRSVTLYAVNGETIGKLWVDDASIPLNEGAEIKAYTEIKGNDYRLIRIA